MALEPLSLENALAVQRAPRVEACGNCLRHSNRRPQRSPQRTPQRSTDRIAIVLVHHGWRPLDQRAVIANQCVANAFENVEVVVVQNRPADHDNFESWISPIEGDRSQLTRLSTANRGFAAGCNAGWRAADTPEWVLFTQADVVYNEAALDHAIHLAQTCGQTCASAPAIIGPSGGFIPKVDCPSNLREHGRQVGHKAQEPHPVDWVTGCWLLAHHDVLDTIDGWDEGYALYYEDPDLCLRAALIAGARSMVCGNLPVDHQRGSTTSHYTTEDERKRIQAASARRFNARWRL